LMYVVVNYPWSSEIKKERNELICEGNEKNY